MFEEIISFVRNIYPTQQIVPLHEPRFNGNERKYVLETIDSTFVSSVGPFVNKFEEAIKEYAKVKYAIASVNGTCALHMALMLVGVGPDTEVITQALTFVATANAIKYCGAEPIFIDSDRKTLGMSAEKLEFFLAKNTSMSLDGKCINGQTGRKISACVPMHVFGHPVNIEAIAALCQNYNIPLVEDAAESLGSTFKGIHTGTFGVMGILSFNGNKTVTTGGGGMIITNNEFLGKKAKHLTTTAKVFHQWEFFHDETGYNYRLPNINAALGCAQMEQLDYFINKKRALAEKYIHFLNTLGVECFCEPSSCRSNYWLNAVVLKDNNERNRLIEITNKNGVMTRPIWCLMIDLPMYRNCQHDGLETARWLQERVVNLPSSVPL